MTSSDHDVESACLNYENINQLTETTKVDQNNRAKESIKDQGWGWVVVVSSLMAHMLVYGVVYSYGVLATEFIKHYGISRSTIGWMGSSLIAVTAGTGPLASFLCKHLTYRTVALIGSVTSVIGFGAPYFYNELWFLIVSSSFVCVIGFGLVYLPSIIIVNIWFEKKRSLAIGIAVCGSGLGTFVFSSIFDVLLTSLNWQMTMLITGGILLLLIPCSLTYRSFNETQDDFKDTKINEINSVNKNNVVTDVLPKASDDNREENYNKTNVKTIDEINEEENNEEIRNYQLESESTRLTKNPIFILFMISNLFTNIGFIAPYMFAKDRAVQLGISSTKGSLLISSIGIGNCLGRLGFGYLATFKSINRFHLYNVTLIMSGIVLIISWVFNHYISMLSYTMIYGMLIGGFVTLTSVMLVDLFGIDKLTEAFGVTLVFQAIGLSLSSPLAGFVYDYTLSYNISFAVCGVLVSLAGMMMYLAYISRDFRKRFQ